MSINTFTSSALLQYIINKNLNKQKVVPLQLQSNCNCFLGSQKKKVIKKANNISQS